MYHLFSHPIATHLSRLFIAAVLARPRALPEVDFWGFSEEEESCFVLLSFVAFL